MMAQNGETMAQYNVPAHLLDKLKCALCYEYLSHPPILLYADTGSVCGRCPTLEAEKNIQPIREKTYEDVASILNFPCRYKLNGCSECLTMKMIPVHEQSCDFKPYFCPVLPLGSCAWQGSPSELNGHFATSHQNWLLDSKYFELDVYNNYKEHYLVPTLEEMFLFRTEFQNADNVFRCSVYYIGKPELALNYEYSIVFNNTKDKSVSWTSPKRIAEPDVNIFDRTNEYTIGLDILNNNLDDPNFITCNLEITRVNSESENLFSQIENEVLITFDDESDEEDDIEVKKTNAASKMMEALECPVCHEYMIPPIFQCITGHSVCSICKPQLRECPTCRGQIGNTRNFTLETITEKMDYPCKNVDEGCEFVANSLNIKKHEGECNFRPNCCPLSETLNCEWTGNIKKVFPHARKEHPDYIQNSAIFQTVYNPTCARFEVMKIKNEHGHNFRIRYSYCNDTNQVSCTVQCLGTTKFMYEMQCVDGNSTGLQLTSKKFCGTLNDNKDDLKHCTLWHLDMVKSFISQQDNILKIKCIIHKA